MENRKLETISLLSAMITYHSSHLWICIVLLVFHPCWINLLWQFPDSSTVCLFEMETELRCMLSYFGMQLCSVFHFHNQSSVTLFSMVCPSFTIPIETILYETWMLSKRTPPPSLTALPPTWLCLKICEEYSHFSIMTIPLYELRNNQFNMFLAQVALLFSPPPCLWAEDKPRHCNEICLT